MHYFQFEIKEWISNTAHLSLEEEAIYLRLILYYYDSEQCISKDPAMVFRKLRITNIECATNILNEYFKSTENGYVHTRCDEVIQKYNLKIESASRAGKASAQARFNSRSTDAQLINNQESLINNQIKTNPIAPKVAIPIGVSESVWKDFLTLRKAKKMAVTQTALKGISREAERANKPLEEVLAICCERGWGGFKAEWLKTESIGNKSNQDWRTNDSLMMQKANELGLYTVGLQRFEIVNKIADSLRSRGL